MKEFYDSERWKDLALAVTEIGDRNDQAYYYLGRSAEGLGYFDAARVYYKLSKTALKCGGVINVYDGLVLPSMVDARLDKLPASGAIANRSGSAPEKPNKMTDDRVLSSAWKTIR
jgi:hypothetical protein